MDMYREDLHLVLALPVPLPPSSPPEQAHPPPLVALLPVVPQPPPMRPGHVDVDLAEDWDLGDLDTFG